MVVRFLVLSDIVIQAAGSLLGPIFALFILDFIDGGSPAVAGIAATIFLITKSVAQMPVATFIDKIRGEKDDFALLFWGSIITALLPLLYLVISTPLELYAVQFLYGLLIALTFPSYMAVFTRHIDKHKEGTNWGVYFTLTDLSSAIAAAVGGVMAETIGYQWLIIIVAGVTLFGALLLYPIKPYLKGPRRQRRRRRR
jgi:MFS family permease